MNHVKVSDLLTFDFRTSLANGFEVGDSEQDGMKYLDHVLCLDEG